MRCCGCAMSASWVYLGGVVGVPVGALLQDPSRAVCAVAACGCRSQLQAPQRSDGGEGVGGAPHGHLLPNKVGRSMHCILRCLFASRGGSPWPRWRVLSERQERTGPDPVLARAFARASSFSSTAVRREGASTEARCSESSRALAGFACSSHPTHALSGGKDLSLGFLP